MIQTLLIMNLFIVVIRFYILVFKDPKPSFKEELKNYKDHLVTSHLLFFTIMFLFYLFS
jgi:hypothetical protein